MYDFASYVNPAQISQIGGLWGGVQQQNTLVNAGNLAVNDDNEAAQNYLLQKGLFTPAKYFADRQDASDKADAWQKAGQQWAAGDKQGAQNTLITSGNVSGAQGLAGLQNNVLNQYNAAQNQANTQEDRAREAEQRKWAEFGTAMQQADTPEKWNQLIEAVKPYHPEIAQFSDFNIGRGRLMYKAGLTQAAPAATDQIAQVQREFKGKYGEDLPYTTALGVATALGSKFNAGQRLAGWQKDATGQWVPQWEADKNTAAAVRQAAINPLTQYYRSVAQQAGKNTGQNLAREQQAAIVDKHYDLAASLAGGWGADKELTPEQQQQRANFENAIGGLQGQMPGFAAIVRGEVNPTADTPAVIRQVGSINQMIKGELTRLATSGQGAVAEGIRHEFDTVVGNFLTMPSTKTYLDVLRFQKKMMGAFTEAPDVGYQAVMRMQQGGAPMGAQPRVTPPPAGNPGVPGMGAPAPAPQNGAAQEGTIIRNAQTGERRIMQGGQWVPIPQHPVVPQSQ